MKLGNLCTGNIESMWNMSTVHERYNHVMLFRACICFFVSVDLFPVWVLTAEVFLVVLCENHHKSS